MHEQPQHAPLDDFADRVAELADALATIARPARNRSLRQSPRTIAAASSAPASTARTHQLSIPTAAITGVVLLP